MMESFIPQNGTVWAAAASSFVVAIGMLYKAFRMVKGDINVDKSIQNVDKFVERQNEKIKDLEDQLAKSGERNETLQKERLTVFDMAATLKGEVKGLEMRVEDLRSNLEQKEKEIARLREEVTKLKLQNENLLDLNKFKRTDFNKEQSGEK